MAPDRAIELQYIPSGRRLPPLGRLSLSLLRGKSANAPAAAKLADLVRTRLGTVLRNGD